MGCELRSASARGAAGAELTIRRKAPLLVTGVTTSATEKTLKVSCTGWPSRQRHRPGSDVRRPLITAQASSHEEMHAELYEVRVCTHRTCRKSGSLQTLELLKGLASPNISVESCGCLGKCGLGPNLVVLPAGIFVSHCNTGAHAARLLDIQCGLLNPDSNLKALALKQQGNKAFEAGDAAQAEALFSQAIVLQPSGGLHSLYTNRSAARLAKGDVDAAMDDALQAAHLAPRWHTPLLRQGEAHMQKGDYHAAQAAYKKALLLDPSLRRSKSYQSKVRDLERKLTPAN